MKDDGLTVYSVYRHHFHSGNHDDDEKNALQIEIAIQVS